MTTDKQKKTVAFIERWLGIKYKGHIECSETASYFIGKHIKEAKSKKRISMMQELFEKQLTI